MQNDLISGKKLITSIKRQPCKLIDKKQYIRLDAVLEKVRLAPTIDAVPVVHGRWRQAKFTQAPLYICSECDSQAYTSHNYCPSYGAKMDGGAEGCTN